MKTVLLILFFVLFLAQNGISRELQFDRSPDDNGVNIVGYHLYYGFQKYNWDDKGNFDHKIDLGEDNFYPLPSLIEGATYHFTVTAYQVVDNEKVKESDLSEFLEYTVPADPIIIPNITVLGVQNLLPPLYGEDHRARFTWEADDVVDGFAIWTAIGPNTSSIVWSMENLMPEYGSSIDVQIKAYPEVYWVAVAPIKNGYMGTPEITWYKPGDINRNGLTNTEDRDLVIANYGPILGNEPVNHPRVLSNLVTTNNIVDRYDTAKILRVFGDL
jgi:hypothetical protein